MDIEQILDAIRHSRVHITDHADEETQADRFSCDEIFSVVRDKLIEDYPDDQPSPICLVYGNTLRGVPVHSVWAYNSENWMGCDYYYLPPRSHTMDRLAAEEADG